MLRERGGDVDTLVPCGEHVARVRQAGAGERLAAIERDSLLLAHLTQDARDFDAIARLFDMLAADGLTQRYVSLGEELLALPAGADEAECDRLARATAELLAPYVARLADKGADMPSMAADTPAQQMLDLLGDYELQTFSPTQRDVVERAMVLLAAYLQK